MSETDQSNLAEQLRQLGFSTDFTIPTHNNDSLFIRRHHFGEYIGGAVIII